MEAVFLKLLNMSITAGWLVLALLILRPFLKKAPKWITCAMWALVGLRLILPFSIKSVTSLIPSNETIPQDIVYQAEPEIESGVGFINSYINPVISESMAPNPGDSANPLQVVSFIATWLWVTGMVVMVLYTIISYIRLRYKVRENIHLQGNIHICDHVSTPFILGIIKPDNCLPSDMSSQDMEYVIAHEQAHLKRRDHWWKPLGFMLLAVYWFNPLMWVAYILLCRDIEMACDEKVIGKMSPEYKVSYSEALLNCSISRKSIAACPLAFGEVGVKTRVKSVLNYKKPAFWIMIAALIVCIAVAVCFLTDPMGRKLESGSDYEGISIEVLSVERDGSRPAIEIEWTNDTDEDFNIGYSYEVLRKEGKEWIPCADSYYLTTLSKHLGSHSTLRKSYNLVAFDLSQPGMYRFESVVDREENKKVWVDFILEGELENSYTLYPAYKPEKKDEVDSPYVVLNHEYKSFHLYQSYLAPYINTGYYEVRGNRLYLRPVFNNSIFVFELEGDSLIFKAAESWGVFTYKNHDGTISPAIEDGAIFKGIESITEESFGYDVTKDYIDYDIDKDGEKEIISMRMRKVSALFTVDFVITEKDNTKKVSTIDMEPGDFTFVERDGKLKIKSRRDPYGNNVVYYNVLYKDGYIAISQE